MPINVEVYDRRIVIYRTLVSFLIDVLAKMDPEIDEIRKFGQDIHEAIFI